MASYDSDESMSDDETGTSTNVLLGYASKEPTEDPTSHLGGVPTWLDPEQPPSYAYARCLSCSQPMSLLLELNGDLPERFPGHERRLYIWGCRKKQCRRKPGSIRALRNVRVSAQAAQLADTALKNGSHTKAPVTQQAPQEPKPNLGAQLFGGGSSAPSMAPPSGNPFSTGPPADNNTKPNPFSPSTDPTPQDLATTFAQKARITDAAQDNLPHPAPAPAPTPAPAFEPWPTPADPTPHPHYHLDADYEYLTHEPAASPTPAHAALLDADNGASEDSSAPLPDDRLDRAFQAFADALAQNPDQALRYEFGGAPLLCTRDDAAAQALRAGIPACGSCGGPRALELQLVPGAIAALEAELAVARVLVEGMEWGTVLVGVCRADCAGVQAGVYVREEWVGVQWEEVVARGGAGGMVEKGSDGMGKGGKDGKEKGGTGTGKGKGKGKG